MFLNKKKRVNNLENGQMDLNYYVMKYILSLILLLIHLQHSSCCTDFYMNFTKFSLSGRTLDLDNTDNWTISTWPVDTVCLFFFSLPF